MGELELRECVGDGAVDLFRRGATRQPQPGGVAQRRGHG